jgi:hypothetical protein
MKNILVSALVLFAVCEHSQANIGFTLGQSQRYYGSKGTYADDNSGVVWNYKGWLVTEYYDPQGLCTKIIYTGQWSDFPDRVVFSFLRINTPPGVTWSEDDTGGPPVFGRQWHSTQYTRDGLMMIHLVANLTPNLGQKNPPHEADGTPHITEHRLSINVFQTER